MKKKECVDATRESAKSRWEVASGISSKADGRQFPTYDGELLSWDISSAGTIRDEQEGWPRTRAIVRAFIAYRPEQLERERRNLVKASFDRIFGKNAEKLLDVVEQEMQSAGMPTRIE